MGNKVAARPPVEALERLRELALAHDNSCDRVALFAGLYDALLEGDRWRYASTVLPSKKSAFVPTSELDERWRSEFDDSLAALDGELGVSDAFRNRVHWASDRLLKSPGSATDVIDLMCAARHIDARFGGIRLQGRRATSGERLAMAIARLSRSGNLLDDRVSDGLVLPAGRCSELGDELSQFFRNLCRIGRSQSVRIDYAREFLRPGARKYGRDSWRVGTVAIVVKESEVVWRLTQHGLGVSVAQSEVPALTGRAIAALEWFSEKGGVDIVVFPELVGHSDIRRSVNEWLKRAADLAPLIVVAGSEAIPNSTGGNPVNLAHVLAGNFHALWEQPKFNRFRFTAARIGDWRLESLFEQQSRSVEDVDEECWAPPPISVCVRDLVGLGRCIVAVCEDLDRDEPVKAVVRTLGPDFVLVPVMDGAPQPAGWWKLNGYGLAKQPMAATVIANSYALISRVTSESNATSGSDLPIGGVFAPQPYPGPPDCMADPESGQLLAAIWEIPCS